MYAVKLAAIACLPLAAGLFRDWRDFGNAILAAVALTLAAFAAASGLLSVHTLLAGIGLIAVALFIASGPLIICAYLLHNALAESPREPPPISRLPSLLLGLAIVACTVLAVAAQPPSEHQLSITTTIIVLVFGYLTSLFLLFVVATRLRRRARPQPDGDVVVVLGSGLLPGGQVPPLLASRLDRGRQVFESLAARGRDPVLIVSGGKGDHAQLAEAEAMARYLTERGFPPEAVVREDESRTTEENLANTAAIVRERRPEASCVIVTSDFHALRTAVLASRLGFAAQVTGTAAERRWWPSATVREFGAVFLSYKLNYAVCLLAVALPLAYLALRS